MSALRVIPGRRLNSLIYYCDSEPQFSYQKKNVSGTTTYFVCSKSNCGAKGVYKDSVFRKTQEHNHLGDPSLVPNSLLRNSFKVRSGAENTPLRTIFNEERAR